MWGWGECGGGVRAGGRAIFGEFGGVCVDGDDEDDDGNFFFAFFAGKSSHSVTTLSF